MTAFGPDVFRQNTGGPGKHRFLVVIEVETWGVDQGDAANRTWANLGIGPGTYAEPAMPTFFKPGPNHVDQTLHSTTIRDLRPLNRVGFRPEIEE